MVPHQASAGSAPSDDSSESSLGGFPVNCLQKAGVFVQRIVTTTGVQTCFSVFPPPHCFHLHPINPFLIYFIYLKSFNSHSISGEFVFLRLFQTLLFPAPTAQQMSKRGSQQGRASISSGALKVQIALSVTGGSLHNDNKLNNDGLNDSLRILISFFTSVCSRDLHQDI